jgi:hypothetical protein
MAATNDPMFDALVDGLYGLKTKAQTQNVLHSFRSYNYIFTLACLEKSEIRVRKTYEDSELKYIIAKSGGKGVEGLKAENIANSTDAPGSRSYNLALAQKNIDFINEFNTSSPGRFDFYFSDVELNNLIAPSQSGGMSKPTSINFTIHEPYSINGFVEALQASAVAAGYATFRLATYMLKIEFIGYPDNGLGISDTVPVKIEPASRYFPMVFNDMEVKSDESGTRYVCKALPVNDLAFGENLNKLPVSLKMSGNTVGAILENLMEGMNKSLKKNYTSEDNKNVLTDEYRILFPENATDVITDVTNYTKNKFYSAAVADLSIENFNYKFEKPVTDIAKQNKATRTSLSMTVDGKTLVTQFKEGTNLHDCISSILKDCTTIQDIFKNKIIDDYGMVEYFYVHSDLEYKDQWSQELQRYLYKVTYSVMPYKIHYSKVWASNSIELPKIQNLKTRVRRAYNWYYTGQNIDIISFNLNLNSLYFQAVPRSLGKDADDPLGRNAPSNKTADDLEINPNSRKTENDLANSSGLGTPTNIDNRRLGTSQSEGPGSGRGFENNPYVQMARNLHRAILDNVSSLEVEIEILGDPFYVVQGGIGNSRPQPLDSKDYFEFTETGEANHISGDVHVQLTFKNAVDYNAETGLMALSENTPFSGIYYITTVNSRFTDGMFKQRLKLLRLPNQEKLPTGTVIDTTPLVYDVIDVGTQIA